MNLETFLEALPYKDDSKEYWIIYNRKKKEYLHKDGKKVFMSPSKNFFTVRKWEDKKEAEKFLETFRLIKDKEIFRSDLEVTNKWY